MKLFKARAVLKLLALAPAHRLQRDQLIDLLWPESETGKAAHSLNQILYNLRPILAGLDASARLLVEDEYISLQADGGISSDVEDFEQAARRAFHPAGLTAAQTGAACLDAIVAYGGDLLPEDGPSDLFYQKRDELRGHYLALLAQLADYNLAEGEYLPAIDTLKKALAIDPLHEEIHHRLMRAYALSGQRQMALRQYQLLEEALRRDLDVEPGAESKLLREQIRKSDAEFQSAALNNLFAPKHNLPAMLSSFIGRQREIAEVTELARANRLVVLTGIGGVGKTRLSLKAAEGLLAEFAQGVYWVELAALSNPSLVARAVLKVLRLPDQHLRSEIEALAEFLQDRHALLILDNCEHLLRACSDLAETLLRACPRLHILATSRTIFSLPGEVDYQVPTLALPKNSHSAALEEICGYDAVKIFTARAATTARGFTLTADNAAAVVEICRRLDGIPLALELAAARARLLTPEQIVEQLQDCFRLLEINPETGIPRHHTMHTSMDWSYQMLAPQDRLLLQRLSVFAGGWQIEAAEAVCGGEGVVPSEVMNSLGRLADQSMLTVGLNAEGEKRYSLLEIVRQYAAARLAEREGSGRLHKCHRAYYTRLAERTDHEIRGPQQAAWLKRMDHERENINSTLERAFSSTVSAAEGAELVCWMSWFWQVIGDYASARYFLEQAYAFRGAYGRSAILARLLFQMGQTTLFDPAWKRPDEGIAYLEASLEIWEELGPAYAPEAARCKLTRGYMRRIFHNDEQGLAELYESMEVFKARGDIWWQAWTLNLISGVLESYADPATVWQTLQDIVQLWRKVGDHNSENLAVMAWGQYQLNHCEYAQARRFLQKSLAKYQETSRAGGVFQTMRDLGHVERALGDYEQAAVYYEDCIQLAHHVHWDSSLAWLYMYRSFTALHLSDLSQLEPYWMRTLKLVQAANWPPPLAACLAGLAALSALQGDSTLAARLLGVFAAQMEAHPPQYPPHLLAEIDYCERLCRARANPETFEQDWQTGRSMSIQQVVCAIPTIEF